MLQDLVTERLAISPCFFFADFCHHFSSWESTVHIDHSGFRHITPCKYELGQSNFKAFIHIFLPMLILLLHLDRFGYILVTQLYNCGLFDNIGILSFMTKISIVCRLGIIRPELSFTSAGIFALHCRRWCCAPICFQSELL